MAFFKDVITEAKCEDLQATVQSVSGRFLCFTRFDTDVLRLCASDGYDLWKVDLDAEDLEAQREEAGGTMESHLDKLRQAFRTGDIQVSQVGTQCRLSVGRGASAQDFQLYEAKALEKKTELQNVLFRLADRVLETEKELEQAKGKITSLQQQQAGSKASGSGMFDAGNGVGGKGQPKAPVKQVGMSMVNPGSRKRKAARGVKYE